jgi:thiol reductant ABC exporter CydC subunit
MAVSAYLISKAAVSTSLVDLSLLITGVRFFAISRAGLRYAERYVNHKATFRILTRLRVWLYTAIEPLAPARLSATHSGDVLTRLVADMETLENFYLRVLIPPFAAAIVTGVTLWLLGSFDVRLAWVLLGFVLLTGVALPLASRRMSKGAAADAVALRSDLNVALLDLLQGMPDLLAYGQEGAQRARVEALSDELHRQQERLALVRGVSGGLALLLTGLAGLSVLALAMPLVSSGQVDGVFLALFPLATIAAFEAIQPLAQSLQWLEISRGAAERIFALIDTPPAVAEGEPGSPYSQPKLEGGGQGGGQGEPRSRQAEPCDGQAQDCESAAHAPLGIDLRDVWFRYAEGEPWVLEGLSLCVEPGAKVAITGPNGAGKSTIANLLLRFWEVEGGSIEVGGVNLREMSTDQVRALFSVVPQHTHLFNATIRDNLYLADPHASDEQLAAACRMAQLHDFIAALPQGYDTVIGENGLRLSGGERQRLAVARAVLKGAPILILDEATSQLDALNERALLESLGPFMQGRTTLVITHRRAALAAMEEVFTLAPPETCAPGRPIPR